MRRFILLQLLLLTPGIVNAQVRYVLRGEITDGSTLFPPGETQQELTWENYGDPPEGYPIDYTGRLNVGPGDDWTFHFTAWSENLAVTHSLAPPVRPSIETGPETLVIDHVGGRSFVEWFHMDLNLDAGTGAWSWRQDCPVCDLAYPLPSAFSTVTSIDLATGDFNDNGGWDIDDIDALMTRIASGSKDLAFDLTGDGVLDDTDRDAWLAEAGPRLGLASPFLLGDANLDGTVNVGDLGVLGVAWRSDESRWSHGNFSGQAVNSADLNLLALNWQASVGLAAAVPEPPPAATSLFWLGIAVSCGWQRRQKSIVWICVGKSPC